MTSQNKIWEFHKAIESINMTTRIFVVNYKLIRIFDKVIQKNLSTIFREAIRITWFKSIVLKFSMLMNKNVGKIHLMHKLTVAKY